jgi:transcriptional regulator with XRE-family HTH domain
MAEPAARIALPVAHPVRDTLAVVREVLERQHDLDEDVHGDLRLGDALVRLRLQQGRGQEELVARSGLTARRVRALEAGDAASAEELVGLGHALGVPPAGLAALRPGRTLQAVRIRALGSAGVDSGHRRDRRTLLLPGFPGALSWDATPWREDAVARAFVEEHPDGATVEEVAAALGLTTRQVERIIEQAARKMRRELE